MLCDKSGYCSKFDIYIVKTEESSEGGLGFRVIKKLMEGLEGKNHKLVFDNFFNSVELMLYLKEKSILAVGTINATRKHMPTFKIDKELKRGEFDWFTSGSGLAAFKWKDKRCVHLLSNFHDPTYTDTVQRREKMGMCSM